MNLNVPKGVLVATKLEAEVSVGTGGDGGGRNLAIYLSVDRRVVASFMARMCEPPAAIPILTTDVSSLLE